VSDQVSHPHGTSKVRVLYILALIFWIVNWKTAFCRNVISPCAEGIDCQDGGKIILIIIIIIIIIIITTTIITYVKS
jgi:hypothetical protein